MEEQRSIIELYENADQEESTAENAGEETQKAGE